MKTTATHLSKSSKVTRAKKKHTSWSTDLDISSAASLPHLIYVFLFFCSQLLKHFISYVFSYNILLIIAKTNAYFATLRFFIPLFLHFWVVSN